MLEPFQFVVGRLQRLVRHHQNIDALFEFDLGDLGALFVQQKRRYIHRDLAQHGGRVVFEGLLLNDAQDLQRRALGITDMACSATTRTRNRRPFAERRAQPLAAHFHQAELADGAELHTCAVLAQCVTQPILHVAPVAAFLHVDEVDDDQSAEVAQAHLARHLICRLQVGAGRGFFDVATTDGAGRVDVDRDQCLGMVNHNGTATGQLHCAGIGRLDLVLDLETRE